MKKFKKFLYIFFLFFFAGTFLVSAFILGRYWINSKQNADQYDDLAQQVAQIQAQQTQPVTPEDQDVPEDTVTTPDEDPVIDEKPMILPEYAPLYQQNADMVGWIRVPDTKINYPVMQTPTMPDYYLYTSFQKEYSRHGAIYVEEACDVNEPSDNVIIYGHHMNDSSMFNALDFFKKKEFWEEHKTFSFDTLTAHHTYEIFAVFKTTATLDQGFGYHEFINAADQAEFDAFVGAIKEMSFYETGITPEYGDKLVCLSTCEYTLSNGRFVVVARRIS